jgi:hypothetical protein
VSCARPPALGVIAEDVHRPEVGEGAVGQRLHLREIADVDAHGDGLAAAGSHGLGHRARGRLLDVGHDHPDPLARERLDQGPADARATARDHGHAIAK